MEESDSAEKDEQVIANEDHPGMIIVIRINDFCWDLNSWSLCIGLEVDFVWSTYLGNDSWHVRNKYGKIARTFTTGTSSAFGRYLCGNVCGARLPCHLRQVCNLFKEKFPGSFNQTHTGGPQINKHIEGGPFILMKAGGPRKPCDTG